MMSSTLPQDRLYVDGLPPETKEAEVLELFKEYDRVTDIHIGLNPWDGTCRGYIHATCSNEARPSPCHVLDLILSR